MYCPILMKLGEKICPDDVLDELNNRSGWLKNIDAREAGLFLFMAIVRLTNTLEATFIVRSS